MSLLYLLALLLIGAGWIVARKTGRPFPSLAPAFIGLVLSYVLAMAALCVDPYYEDNGLPEFIEWRFRWMWAAGFAGWFSLIVVPIILMVRPLVQRRQPKS